MDIHYNEFKSLVLNDSDLLNSSIKRNNFQTSFVIFFLFILPQSFYSVIPSYLNSYFFGFLSLCYIGILVYNFKLVFKIIDTTPFLITLLFISLGIINMIAHKKISYFNIVAPIFTYAGYRYILNRSLNIKWFFYFFIISYVFYFIVYYSQLPDLFFRPGFDEDAAVFDNSSSNAIPISLNITLFFFIILNYLYQERFQKQILIIAIVNFSLIVIQQSRGGLLVSFILIFISLFDYNKKMFLFSSIFISIVIFLFLSFNIYGILDYLDNLGDFNGIDALNQDVRGIAQAEFFNELTFFNLVFGYPPNTTYVVWAGDEINYTYNVFLDVWNKYSILGFIMLLIIIVNRIIFNRNFFLPLYYLIPFLVYCMIESLFFPNFWDAIIFILFFTKKNTILQSPIFASKNKSR